jgi:hypothetical protein
MPKQSVTSRTSDKQAQSTGRHLEFSSESGNHCSDVQCPPLKLNVDN